MSPVVSKKGRPPRATAGPTKKQQQVKHLHGKLQILKKRRWEASDEERAAVDEISA